MCILFVHVNPNPKEGEYRVIVANNRDEYYHRPALDAQWSEESILGGKDMEPGREGGMWFGCTIKDLANGEGKNCCIATMLNKTGEKIEHGRGKIVTDYLKTKGMWCTTKDLDNDEGKKCCIATLLNITGEKIEHGRGKIVKDYLKTNLSFEQYVKTLEQSNFSGFNFVGIEISKDDCRICHYSNAPKIFSVYSGKETLGFGNSPTYTPLTKVTKGRYKFEEIISKGLKNEELVDALLNLLKDETRHLPDEELEKRNPEAYILLSSIFVKIKDPGYGTRAHSILLIDYNWNLQFVEHALKQPIDIEKPEWNINKFQSSL